MIELFKTGCLPDYIHVKVIPQAKREHIKLEGDKLKIYVTVVPEDGKANDAVIKILAKALKLPKSCLTITKGKKSREKTIMVKPK